MAVFASAATGSAHADLRHEAVEGAAVERVEVRGPTTAAAELVAWSDLGAPRAPGLHVLRFQVQGAALEIPHCAGRGRVLVDGAVRDAGSPGPRVLTLDGARVHDVRVEVNVSAYERRIACGEPPRAGAVTLSRGGLARLAFTSPHGKAGGGVVVVFVPRGHDATKPAALLVGAHPWNGSPWTYAAYRELLEEAQARDVVLAMPSGLGNSLYTQAAEDEVMRAVEAVRAEVAVDPRRVSIWGASMGGAGATTIAFHRPDRFAFVASFFGDSKYDLTTYVRGILGDERGARRVDALAVVENARHLPVWLVHGEADRTSPILQSTMLEAAMKQAGFDVGLERVPGAGHEGTLVARFLRRVVARAESSRAPVHPARVSYRSVRAVDTRAYGVHLVRAGEGDAFVDLENVDGRVLVHRAEGVLGIRLAKGALGGAREEDGVAWAAPFGPHVSVSWER